MPTYTVEATCIGTIREVWRVTSDRPLIRAEVIAAFRAQEGRGIIVTFESQTTADEDDRTVTSILDDDSEELADVDPRDEDCAPTCASRVPFGECTCGRADRIAAYEENE